MTKTLYNLWRIKPRLVNNPVILRELVVRLRKRSSFFYLALFQIIAVILISFFWYYFTNNYYRGVRWDSQIREMFLILNLFQGLTVSLLIPLISSTIVNIEREQETWDLLRTTPLNLATIILGKFSSAVFFVWLLLISLIPFYGIFLTSGGVSPQEIGIVFLLFTEIIVVVAIFGLLCSIYCKRTVTAVSATYFLGFVYIIGTLFGRVLFCAMFTNREIFGTEIFFSPLLIAIVYFANGIPPSSYIWEFARSHPYKTHIFMILGLIVFLLFLSFRKLNQQSDRLSKPRLMDYFSGRRTTSRTDGSLQSWFPPRLIPQRLNPVYVKDRRELFGRWRLPITAFLLFIAGGFLFLSSFEFAGNRFNDQLQYMVLWTVFLPFIIMPYAANSIRGEFDRDTYDLLATTTLGARKIAQGKIKAGFRAYLWRFLAFYLFPFLAFFLGSLGTYDYRIKDLLYGTPIVFFVSSYFFLSLGVYCSSLRQKTTTAYALTFALALLIFIGVPIFVEMFIEFIRLDRNFYRQTLYPLCGMLSPFFVIVNYGSSNNQWQTDDWWRLIFLQALWMIPCSILLQTLTQRNLQRIERA